MSYHPRDDGDELLDESERRKPLFRCHDRTCGGLDCAHCYGEQAAREYLASEEEE